MKSLWKALLTAAILGVLWTEPARADLHVVIIQEFGLPFSLSQTNFANSPTNFANSNTNFANAETNFANSPTNYSNNSSNYANGPNGQRRLLSSRNVNAHVVGDAGLRAGSGYESRYG